MRHSIIDHSLPTAVARHPTLLNRARMIAVAFAVGVLPAPVVLAQVHVVGIDANGALVHNRTRLNGEALVQVQDLKPPKTITITNKTGFEVKVYEYNAGDVVMAVARKGTTLKDKASLTVSNDGSNIKVFKPALFDEYLTMYRNARTSLDIVKSGNSATVKTVNDATTQSLIIVNTAQEALKIAVYDENDIVQAIPKYLVVVKPGVTANISRELGDRFRVSVFWPRVLDEKSWSEVVKHSSKLTISDGVWTGWQQASDAKSTHGISELTVDPETNTAESKSAYFVYGVGEGGKLWSITLWVEERSEHSLREVGKPTEFYWGKWESIGFENQMHGGLSVVSLLHDLADTNKNNQELFSLDQTGQVIRMRLHHYPWGGDPWTKHGGSFAAHPSAVAPGAAAEGLRRVSLYAIDSADKTLRQLSETFTAGKANTNWTNLGGTLLGAPSVIATEDKARVDVFARGVDSQLWHRAWFKETGWKPWESLGGNITSSPAAVQDGKAPQALIGGKHKPIIRVFAKGTAGDYQMITWNGDEWGKWESLGGKFSSAPIAVYYEYDYP